MIRLIAVLLASLTAGAMPARSNSGEYSHRIWRAQDGLPQSKIQALAQTKDGYLWIGTSGGLVRFDGVRFTVFDRANVTAFSDDSVLTLLAGRDGSLWIGTEGGGLLHLRNGIYRAFGTGQGLTNLFVRSIHEDRSGTIWAGTDRGFFRFDSGALRRMDGTPEIPVAAVLTMCEAKDGTLWLGGPAGLFYVRAGKLFRFPFLDAVRSIYETRDGTLWMATSVGVKALAGGTLKVKDLEIGRTDARILLQDGKDNLWIGTVGEGLIRLHNGSRSIFREQDSLPDNSVLAIFEDREENLWIGTQDGLLRLSQKVVSVVGAKEGLEDDNVSTVYQDNGGTAWLTTITGQIYRLKNNRAVPFRLPNSGESSRATTVYQDASGSYWIGTSDRGIAHVKGNGTEFYSTKDGMRNSFARQFFEDRKGSLWIATSSGLIRWDGRKFQNYYLEEGLAYGGTRAIAELPDGDLLVGTDGGLNRIHENRIVRDSALAAFTGDKIWSILPLPDGTVWIGSRGNGLFRWKNNRAAQFTTREGLLSNSIYQVLDDGKGRLWMSSPAGIFSADRNDLNALADGKPGAVAVVPYGIPEGLESNQMNGGVQSAGCRTAAGDLWFPSVKGAVRIDPGRLRPSNSPPVLIEQVLSDETAIPIAQDIQIPAGRRKLEVDFTACSFLSPERIRFKYKLEGFDEGWTSASSRRSAFYTNLPPRRYRFRVLASDATAERNPSEASIGIVWQPLYYQRRSFYFLCAALSAVAVWAFFRIYAKQTTGRYALLLAERTRLAREMHDTVIQGCVGVSTLLEAASSLEEAHAAKARSLVEQARLQVRATIEEARQAVWDLRSASACGDLASTLSDFTRRIAAEKDIEIRTYVEGEKIPMPEHAERNLALVAREAIRNAIAHGHAQRIEVKLLFDESAVRLEIADDGRGFDAANAPGADEGHYGILGMQERVEHLGGGFELRSAPGEGATVIARLALNGSARGNGASRGAL